MKAKTTRSHTRRTRRIYRGVVNADGMFSRDPKGDVRVTENAFGAKYCLSHKCDLWNCAHLHQGGGAR